MASDRNAGAASVAWHDEPCCGGLRGMAADVRPIVADRCPLCWGTGTTCLAQCLHAWVANGGDDPSSA
ncbi:hypothetical protein SAMN05216241_11625 [Limimonas halophila]|uniref:Uncharacterized protein n=1 Tax=Limimonas halophila TaxID=1082479 RepID=A0A1G7US00_9PROT|nr:hypothetical protein SAMN05216241_11625 [Limimonas halophila]